jgi:dihydroxy-acid dehydratase
MRSKNAITVLMALGGSTNAVVHLIAIAGRVGIRLTLEDFDRISRRTPCIVNVKPSGEFLMEDLFHAGGVPAVMNRLADLLNVDSATVNGKTIGENIASARSLDNCVIRTRDEPLYAEGGIAMLYGSLAPDGAVIKQSAAWPALLQHRGPAFVFETRDEMMAGIDDPPPSGHSRYRARDAELRAQGRAWIPRVGTSGCRASCWSRELPIWSEFPTRE